MFILCETAAFASLYQCSYGNKTYFFDSGNTPQKYCTKKLCYAHNKETKKEEQICNFYTEYPNPNYAQKCIADYKKIYNEKFKDYKSGNCYPYKIAIVQYEKNKECSVDFIVKNGKAVPQKTSIKETGDIHKCENLLINTYPKLSPYIKLRNPLDKKYKNQYNLD